MRARHRLSKLLLRHGIVYSGGTAWTGVHDAWLRAQRFDQPRHPAGVRRRLRGDAAHRRPAATGSTRRSPRWPPTASSPPVVRRLGCLRGISTLTGFGLAVEIGDWHRFTGATIGAYLGLVPAEYSSGESRSQGSITKTGNTHARRLLVEAAWHHRRRYRPRQDHARPLGPGPGRGRARGHAGQPPAAPPLGRASPPARSSP